MNEDSKGWLYALLITIDLVIIGYGIELLIRGIIK